MQTSDRPGSAFLGPGWAPVCRQPRGAGGTQSDSEKRAHPRPEGGPSRRGQPEQGPPGGRHTGWASAALGHAGRLPPGSQRPRPWLTPQPPQRPFLTGPGGPSDLHPPHPVSPWLQGASDRQADASGQGGQVGAEDTGTGGPPAHGSPHHSPPPRGRGEAQHLREEPFRARCYTEDTARKHGARFHQLGFY